MLIGFCFLTFLVETKPEPGPPSNFGSGFGSTKKRRHRIQLRNIGTHFLYSICITVCCKTQLISRRRNKVDGKRLDQTWS